ncbi:hypothetical protein M422DRAFT_250759 [Sphaerobolus stellatus SS14]|uniref:Uncharacterized protein n=1 Tax=Sphaerobolus stellatus (strain SS14) TaxID=990650 RepID=A0A0C9W405_SPHS4|nr:hypothetical protein M422DRAFT_250759 [Sphaerobolus stellatus SS14]
MLLKPIAEPRIHSMTATVTGKAAMPALGSSRAPKTFEGNKEDIAEFLEQFKNCTEDSQLLDEDKVKFLFRYLGRQQKDIFKTFEGYNTGDWATFLVSIKEAFEGAFTEKKYTCQSIIQFARVHSAAQITTDVELRTYHRELQAIAHYLVKESVISDEEHSHYFWFGLHEAMCQAIEQMLAVTHPLHDRTKPYSHADIFTVGKYVFNINTFYNNPPEGLDVPAARLKLTTQGMVLSGEVPFWNIYWKMVEGSSSFYLQKIVDGYGRLWNVMECYGMLWKVMEPHGNLWKVMGGYGRSWKILEVFYI